MLLTIFKYVIAVSPRRRLYCVLEYKVKFHFEDNVQYDRDHMYYIIKLSAKEPVLVADIKLCINGSRTLATFLQRILYGILITDSTSYLSIRADRDKNLLKYFAKGRKDLLKKAGKGIPLVIGSTWYQMQSVKITVDRKIGKESIIPLQFKVNFIAKRKILGLLNSILLMLGIYRVIIVFDKSEIVIKFIEH